MDEPVTNAARATMTVVPVESLIPDAGNVRRRDARATQALGASLRQFGPARSIVLDGRDIVRAGNGTLEAAQAAGCTEVLVIEPAPGQLVAVKRGDWTPTEATAYSIGDNHIGDLATDDPEALAAVLATLHEEEFDLAAIGYSEEEYLEAVGEGALPADADGKEYDESVADEVEYIECPECHHRWPK